MRLARAPRLTGRATALGRAAARSAVRGRGVAVAPSRLDCMARREALTLGVDDQPRQQAGLPGPGSTRAVRVGGEAGLHLVPQGGIDDRLVLTGIARALMDDRAPVEAIVEQIVEGPPAERRPASDAAIAPHSPLAGHAFGEELSRHRDERHIMPVEDLDEPGKIRQRPGQPVDLVDDEDVDPPRLDVGEQALQRRAGQRGAGDAAIVVPGREGSVATFGITRESPLGGPRYTANPNTLWISRV